MEGYTSKTDGLSFSRFLDLPLELRRKVWRHAFPNPRVLKNLSLDQYGTWNGEPLSFHCVPPTTLFVNHESRTETLLEYRDLSAFLDTLEKHVYFSPSRDALHLGSLIAFTEAESCVSFLASHTTHIIQQLSHIQILVLGRLFMDDFFRKFLLNEHGMTRWPRYRNSVEFSWKWDGDESELEGGILAKFHGLEKLFLVMDWGEHALRDGATIDDCKESFRRYFENERQKWPDCKIPEIVVLPPGDVVV